MIDRFISWLYIRRIWGYRCAEYSPGCPCCEQWAWHDWMFAKGAEPGSQSRPMTGFMSTLTEEQRRKAFEYDGPINSGDGKDDHR